jgi:hypothetical protein
MSLQVGRTLSSHVMQAGALSSSSHRLLIGATGLALRPTIDYYNGDVDQKTRHYAAIKTAVKVAITVFNGVLTRFLAEKYGQRLVEKGSIKVPAGVEPKVFTLAVATAVSFLATVLTTFTLDIPLINYGLNFALKHILPKKDKEVIAVKTANGGGR